MKNGILIFNIVLGRGFVKYNIASIIDERVVTAGYSPLQGITRLPHLCRPVRAPAVPKARTAPPWFPRHAYMAGERALDE